MKQKKPLEPTGFALVDGLAALPRVTLTDYLAAVSQYVVNSASVPHKKKAAQIRLSLGLAMALKRELEDEIPKAVLIAGEHEVAGALRPVNVDVCEVHPSDGLRLAVEIKPVNLAVGRALWNRFGDIRTVAVNLHLKFPFAVVGGVLAIPTYELTETKTSEQSKKSTVHLIQRAVDRLARAGGRRTEGDPPHLLEGVAVLVYDPDTATLDPTLPTPGTGLRWEEFVRSLINAYAARFED